MEENIINLNGKNIEVINNSLIRVYKEKNSSKLVKLSLEHSDLDLKINDEEIRFNDYLLKIGDNQRLSVYKNDELLFNEISNNNFVRYDDEGEVKTRIKFEITDKAYIYGLGDKAAFLNRKGYQYVSWNTDDPTAHNETYRSLYKSINFMIINDRDKYVGIFYPSSYKTLFDLGKTFPNEINIISQKGSDDYFLILGDNPLDIIRTYSLLVGRTFLPRLKMLGNQQSRWSYAKEEDFRYVVNGYKSNKLPLDYIHLDIDYMVRFSNFTVDKEKYPNLKSLSDEMKEQGIDIVAIYDAGVKVEKGYFFYDNLLKMDYLLTLDNKPYVNVVWPGDSVFPNYFDSKCREYVTNEAINFEEKYGIAGIWCDMNEPASFNGPLPLNVEARKANGEVFYHDEFHNMYGEYMTRSIAKSFTRRNLRPFVITRACFATTSKYSLVWNGDNQSLWHHLEASLPQVATMNICNFPLDGVDVGGFNCDVTKELLIRWIEANIFNPFLRNHSSAGTRGQEPWAFDEETLNVYRDMLSIRYELIPYLYDLSVKAHLKGEPIIRPLFVNFPFDEKVKEINDQVMIGESLMICPIVHQGKKDRVVYLPEGNWYDYFTHQKYEGNKKMLVEIPLDKTCIFVKEGAILPKYRNLLSINKNEIDEIIFDASYGEGTYINYEDDGETLDYLQGESNEYCITNHKGKVSVEYKYKGYVSPYKHIYVYDGKEYKDVIDELK